jgi:hypothetical protein
MKQVVTKSIFMTLYTFNNSRVKELKKPSYSWEMKPLLLQYILHYNILEYFYLLFLGHEATSISIYPTLYYIKYLILLFLGHYAISTSIYPTLYCIKYLTLLFLGH